MTTPPTSPRRFLPAAPLARAPALPVCPRGRGVQRSALHGLFSDIPPSDQHARASSPHTRPSCLPSFFPFPSFARSPPVRRRLGGRATDLSTRDPWAGRAGRAGRARFSGYLARGHARPRTHTHTHTRTHAHTHAPRKRPRPPTHLKKVAIIVLRKEGRPQTALGGRKQAEPAETNKHSWEGRHCLEEDTARSGLFQLGMCARFTCPGNNII